MFVVLALCAVAVANLRRNGTGRRFLAVRANERAAAAAGINVSRTKLLAFAIAAGLAGIGGVMLGFKQNDVSSANFVYQSSIVFLAFAYLGGITSINGAIIGGLLAPAGLITVVSNYFFDGANLERYTAVIGGASLVLHGDHPPRGHRPVLPGDPAALRPLAAPRPGRGMGCRRSNGSARSPCSAPCRLPHLAGSCRHLQQGLDAAARCLPGPVHPLDRDADRAGPTRRTDRIRRATGAGGPAVRVAEVV